MLDLLVTSDCAIVDGRVLAADLGVVNGTIAAIGTAGSLTTDAKTVIDARGKIVVPGGIDPHVHCSWPIMHETPDGPIFSGSPSVASRAALCGGTTTLIDFAVWRQGMSVQDALSEFMSKWDGKSHCDYSAHLMLVGDPPDEVIHDIHQAVDAGFPSVKMFTTDVTPNRRGRKVSLGTVHRVLVRTAETGAVAAIHAEDDDLVMQAYADHVRDERVAFPLLPEVHSALAEEVAIRRVLQVAGTVSGCTVYFMHVSAAGSVRAIADAKHQGIRVYGETLHQYAIFPSDAYLKPNGQIYHTYPSLKSRTDIEALWSGVASGAIGSIGTDAIITSLSDKLRGNRIDDVTGGSPGLEPRMAVIYSEAVSRRGLSLVKFVDITSANAAKVFGLFPQKGSLGLGSDADIAIFDRTPGRTIALEDLHETDYSPWEGQEVTVWPSTTILRGNIVYERGMFQGELEGRQVRREATPAQP